MTRCVGCKFYVRRWRDDLDESRELGECRRRPPVVDSFSEPHEVPDGPPLGARLFPVVDPSDWCGEFRAKIV